VRPLGPGNEPLPGYQVIAHFARSNAYDVYDAWSLARGCRVILKTVRPDRRAHDPVVARLLREGRLLSRLTHPNLVRAYEVAVVPRPTVVLETLGGETLAHMLDRRELGLPPAELGHLGLQLCSALGYLHAEGWLHLDLKPSNMVAEGGRARVIDLSHATRPGRVKAEFGTWCYQAPEQARGGRVGTAADVWGLGGVLFEAATGRCAFDDENEHFDYPQLHRPAAPVGHLRRALPEALAAAIDACLAPDPEARPALGELAAACEAAAGLPLAERRLVSPGDAPATEMLAAG
jgi:eukaryotic-like serine/threonine-protein kinase